MINVHPCKIGIICFDNTAEFVRESIVKMLELDGYKVGIWSTDILESEHDALSKQQIQLYGFARNQFDNIVIFLTKGCDNNVLMHQALQMAIQFKELDSQKKILVVECGEKIPLEFQGQLSCLFGDEVGSARLTMQIESFFNEKPEMQEKDQYYKKEDGTQNIVVAGVIKNSSFF